MWIFSNKSSGVLSAAGLSSDDVLSGFTIEEGSLKEDRVENGLAWVHQAALSKKSGDRVSIFTCQPRPGDKQQVAAAVKRMKTLRHPNILAWVAGSKMEDSGGESAMAAFRGGFHIVTELVTPLRDYIHRQADAGGCDFGLVASWGIFQLARTLAFLYDDCQLSHNNVSPAAVYVNRSGEWKLANLQYVSLLSEAAHQNSSALTHLRPG